MAPASGALAERPTARRRAVSVARALGSTTRAAIYAHLQAVDGPLTVRDVAGAFDLHPNVARTHLETLADAGLVGVGLRKHPGGGRPAKLYQAHSDVPDGAEGLGANGPGGSASASLLVRLLAGLLDAPAGQQGQSASLASRAHDAAATEARRLVLADHQRQQLDPAQTLEEVAERALRSLRQLAPDTRVARAGRDWVDVTGLHGTFSLLAEARPDLADALERGLLCGALAGAGVPVTLADAGEVPGRGRVWRARATGQAAARPAVQPVDGVDVRGQPRETGVVRAMRAVTRLRAGDVLEVLAEGPGSPAAFARWADRAGHQLLGVERATDAAGRPGIRLLIRKGA
ncbi:MAG TPA: helix-turn-helix domain-containing protein [Egibacteraceae bacterium]|nr:helix-turn-helix domain-containing protein [Egibacteraceae bacterium]